MSRRRSPFASRSRPLLDPKQEIRACDVERRWLPCLRAVARRVWRRPVIAISTGPALALAFLACAGGVAAQPLPLGDLSLEDLGNLEVTTVSRKAQRLSDTPAAVAVVSADDIRRSGARSVPEALRSVPGVDVAKIGAGRFAVTIRGFNGRFSNKLLVQVDGRSLYSPFFSGVFWESLNLMIEDVERIEVIRGPGASLWGANAVNGIINIVTRRATATQGGLVSALTDDRGHVDGAAHYGFAAPGNGAIRLFARGAEISPSVFADGSDANDALRGWRAGFRYDGAPSPGVSLMLQGGAFRQRTQEALELPPLAIQIGLVPPTFELRHEGSDLLGRLVWAVGGGEMAVQAYIDRTREKMRLAIGKVDSVDLDFQHRLPQLGRHELLWGAGFRHIRTALADTSVVLLADPGIRNLHVASAFLQDEIALEPNHWKLTLGAKAEHETLSGFELQPNIRLMWTPNRTDTAWVAWSRAVRTPAVGEHDTTMVVGVQAFPLGTSFPAAAIVSRRQPGYEMPAERLDATEFGVRHNLGNGSLEAVAFAHRYTRLLTATTSPAGPALPGTVPLPFPPFSLPDIYVDRTNTVRGYSAGLELGFDVPLTASLRLVGSYMWKTVDLGRHADPVKAAAAGVMEASTPRHSASLRLAAIPAPGHELDVALRHVSAVQAGAVPTYTAVDARYAWKLNRNVEIALIAQNLFDPSHLEFVTDYFPAKPLFQPRRAFLQGTLRF